MELLPTLIGVVLVACAAGFALLPLVRGAPSPSPASQPALRERYDLYRQVMELEFDYQVGKLAREDYEQLSAELLGQAGSLLREERGTLADLDAEIEHEIAAARAAFAAARAADAQRPAGAPS
jgi:hypothetical protein